MIATTTTRGAHRAATAHPLAVFGVLASVVFAASLAGILTRPVGALAALWPANAILLGMLVRFAWLARGAGWAGAVVGYLAADLLTGSSLASAIWLTSANLGGVAAGLAVFRRMSPAHRALRAPLSMLYLAGACVISGLGAATTGAVVGAWVAERNPLQDFVFWFVTEVVNSLVILPVLLSFGRPSLAVQPLRAAIRPRWLRMGAPLVLLTMGMALSVWLGGAGAMVFVLPGLIWGAVTFSLFGTAVLTLLTCGWLLVGVPLGAISLGMPLDTIESLSSFRLGVALLAVAPLTVASLNLGWNVLHARLTHAAEYDALTGVLSRRAFFGRSQRWLSEPGVSHPCAILMCDVDRFKAINDTYGHAAGDAVLRALAHCLRDELDAQGWVGRLGGEEFALFAPLLEEGSAHRLAERLRAAVAAVTVSLADGRAVQVTMSVGVAAGASEAGLDERLHAADQALYAAKHGGRDRVVLAPHPVVRGHAPSGRAVGG